MTLIKHGPSLRPPPPATHVCPCPPPPPALPFFFCCLSPCRSAPSDTAYPLPAKCTRSRLRLRIEVGIDILAVASRYSKLVKGGAGPPTA